MKNIYKNKYNINHRLNQADIKFNQINEAIQNLPYEIYDDIVNGEIKLPKVLSIDETLDDIIKNKKSVCRFGDGEFRYITEDIFPEKQYFNTKQYPRFREKLKRILVSDDEKILVCLWDFWGSLKNKSEYARKIARNYMANLRETFYSVIDFNKTYGNAFITRFYTTYEEKFDSLSAFNKLKQIWQGKDVIIVEGRGSLLGVGNDLFKNAKTVKRIECPEENAISKYDEIYSEILKVADKDNPILLALGMCATCLAYDLAKDGFWAIDIGHLDLEYEWFLRNSKVPVAIENKYINDIGQFSYVEQSDEAYLSEIIAKVGF